MTNPASTQPSEWKNLFGICACLGEDLGFNPDYLRIALGTTLILNPVAVLSVYFGLGAVVLVTRVLFPNPKRVTAPAPVVQEPEPEFEFAQAA